jgi:transcription-repair coupling factor (superfamily II helicase)
MAPIVPLLALEDTGSVTLANVPDGAAPLIVADLARQSIEARRGAPGPVLLVVARDAERMAAIEKGLAFVAPDLGAIVFPAWDCLPYDRVSPNPDVVARRMTTLSRLARGQTGKKPAVLLTTVNAAVQRVPARAYVGKRSFSAAVGNRVLMDDLVRWLEDNGYQRNSTVRETGEYAVRGGLIDLFPPGRQQPWRLDFFGETLDAIRAFDAESQRSIGTLSRVDLVAMSEVILESGAVKRFLQGFARVFGAPRGDPLYDAVSQGRRHQGMEHWLPLFHETLETIFDYAPAAPLLLDHHVEDAARERFETVADYHDARRKAMDAAADGGVYKPLAPDALYLAPDEWRTRLGAVPRATTTPFAAEGGKGATIDAGFRAGRTFAAERQGERANVFDAVVAHATALREAGKRLVVASWTAGARERLGPILVDHGIGATADIATFEEAAALPRATVALAVLPVEQGFEGPDFALMSEQDILGDRFARPKTKRKKASDFIAEVTSLQPGDVVVHVEHGIGRFVGLKTISAAGAPHDCLEIHYAGETKLFLPVENIDLLSRFGSDDAEVQLDRLGGGAWQARKAKMKQRLRDMAGKLIAVAAERAMRQAPAFVPAEGAWDEFRARFPYDETEDQLAAIEAVLDDLGSGKPMDRLVCGDVGFGKTEVALRAAFVTALSGKQVAVVVPTTLLSRQHFKTFAARFDGLPVVVRQASRLVSAKDLNETKKDLAEGKVDIVVGTHALLGKGVAFKDLGLLVVDEEQHFGVAHKERLKEMRKDVHVLTLSATPIPRTLQLALTGVRELSLITTAPVDRLAVRGFVTPFDPLVIREALLRERYRGGQAFYVCPKIADLGERREWLAQNVPEVSVAVAHGQMSATDLEDIMNAFYDGKYDVLLSTSIVESGLDIPTANTLIVHRAEMFGLAQLYQLKGRVGRSKTRAYAYFTTPEKKKLGAVAERRLKVLQSLDSLGAGFQLASHDLDIRGAGNLLGEEQSGHIREVGYELYQQMLQEAIAEIQQGHAVADDSEWSPQISVGTPVLLPETYVPDLALRLSLYRRLGEFDDEREIEGFAAELIDRFGPLPSEADHLLRIVALKALCRKAGVEKIDAGPKGALILFRGNAPPNPGGVLRYVTEQGALAKLRPDGKLVLIREWDKPDVRLKGATTIMRRLAAIGVEGTKKAA